MKQISDPPEARRQRAEPGRHFVQTERKAHEEWARFSLRKPTASAVLHMLIAKMGSQNAVVISQTILAQLVGVSDRSIRTAITDLAANRWIQVVRIGKGREAAYIVNDQVAWAHRRDDMRRLSLFTATVVASEEDQHEIDQQQPLRRLPRMFAGEMQLPTGDGLPPPSEPSLPGMEPDLPALREPDDRQPMDEAMSLGTLVGGIAGRLSEHS